MTAVELDKLAQAQADRLIAGGVRAVIDARDLNPPGALIRPPVLSFRFGGCNRLTWTVLIVAPDAGTRGALSTLGDLVEKAQAALGFPSPELTPVDVATLDGGTVPGYSLTYVTQP